MSAAADAPTDVANGRLHACPASPSLATPRYASPRHTTPLNIIGPASVGRLQVYRGVPPDAGDAASDVLEALWWAAIHYGVDPVVAVSQSAHEAGWWRYQGAVPVSYHNVAGLKTRDGHKLIPPDQPLSHAQFASWEAGALAQAQHLLAYCGFTREQVEGFGYPLLAPRSVWVYGKHAITTVEELGGRWAPSPGYGHSIVEVARRLSVGG